MVSYTLPTPMLAESRQGHSKCMGSLVGLGSIGGVRVHWWG